MKSYWNRLFLKLSHFFGYRLDCHLKEDITLLITTQYPCAHDDTNFPLAAKLVTDDIFKQTYNHFNKDKKFLNKCRDCGGVWIKYSSCFWIEIEFYTPYINGKLIYPDEAILIMNREKKLKQLLN